MLKPIQVLREWAHGSSSAWPAPLLVYLVSTDFVQVHDQARQCCQFKKTFFFKLLIPIALANPLVLALRITIML